MPEQQAPQLLSSLPLQVLAPAQVQEQVQEQVQALVEALAQVQEQVQALGLILEQAQVPIELAAMPSIHQQVPELAVPEASAERRVLAPALVLVPERVMGDG